ncbi:MAG: hypothetical protein PHI28_00265 [Mangrovibacterium sp.]|nr:hypothetical protein [Mangrovibacterium sp.]
MGYLSQITSGEKPDFCLQIILDGEHTFEDFHAAIQKACGYSPNQMASFFLPGHSPGKQIEITELDSGFSGFPHYLMGKTQLKSLLKSAQQRFTYVFDFFQDRSFDIELTEIFMEKNLVEPSITLRNGDAPAQVLEEEIQEQNFAPSALTERCDYGDLDDYTEIFGEMEDLLEGR